MALLALTGAGQLFVGILFGLLVVALLVSLVQLARQSIVWQLVIVIIVSLVAIVYLLSYSLTPA